MDDDIITILGNRVRLRQIEDGFKTSTDSVMLAAACPAQKGDSVLDLGCGVGSSGFCLLYRVPDTKLTGIDVLPDHIEIAKENASLNHKDARAVFLVDDIRDYDPVLDGSAGFDHVICNPPFLEGGAHIKSPSARKELAIGFGEDDMDLKDWIDAAHRNLRSGGTLTTINRADTTDKIIREMGRRFGAIEIIPLWPKLSVSAKRVIIRGIKDRKSPSTLYPGIVMHNKDGTYSEAAEAILRDGRALHIEL